MNSPVQPQEALERVWVFCTGEGWSGWDPYDGLMARFWPATLLLRSRWGRLALIQGVKRSPLNVRPLLGIPRLRNPKALALGLEAACWLSRLPGWKTRANQEGARLLNWLLDSAVKTQNGKGWGYPFDWQARAFLLPRGTPTVVCTGFVVRALDYAFRTPSLEVAEKENIRSAIDQAAAFVRNDLHRSQDQDGFCWSYSPLDTTRVVNATLLGAEVLARAGRLEKDPSVFSEIKGTLTWSASRQQPEGGWAYGEAHHHRWEDAFHTGFNLMSLEAIRRAAQDLDLDPETLFSKERFLAGLTHYRRNFFGEDGAAWYFRGRPYPLDTHAAAVGLIVLGESGVLDPSCFADFRRVLDWSLNHLWNPRKGLFLFQKHPNYTVRIPYLRWSQAWMLLALSRWATIPEGKIPKPSRSG